MNPDMRDTRLEVLFTPAEFRALDPERLRNTTCVVFDVLRATTSMITALAHGATGILPVAELPEALSARQHLANALLAGERAGRRIDATQTGGAEFDFGNSPREFASESIRGRPMIWTTTNGTRALRSTKGAQRVFAGAFLNLSATAACLRKLLPASLLLIGSGTYEEAAWEDTLAAGGLCDALWDLYGRGQVADSATMARRLFRGAASDLESALAQGRNGRRLLARPDLADDVAFAARRDSLPLVAELGADGWLRSMVQATAPGV